MRWHVVGAFEIVHELRIAVGYQTGGEDLEIAANGRVGILAEDQRALCASGRRCTDRVDSDRPTIACTGSVIS